MQVTEPRRSWIRGPRRWERAWKDWWGMGGRRWRWPMIGKANGDGGSRRRRFRVMVLYSIREKRVMGKRMKKAGKLYSMVLLCILLAWM